MNQHATETHDYECQKVLLPGKPVDLANEVGVPRSAPFLCSQRWIFSYLIFYFGFVVHMLRVNMSLTLPYMVRSTDTNTTADRVNNISHTDNATISSSNECHGTIQTELDIQNAEFTWNKITQSMILAAYFWGYIIPQIPGGWLSGKYGGKRIVAVGMALSTVLTLLTPVLARASPFALMVDRFLIGLLAGVSFPAVFNLVGLWSLPHERSRILGMLFFVLFGAEFYQCLCLYYPYTWFTASPGNAAGIVVGILTSGVLCDKGFDNGWGSVFYVHGICSVFFLILWIYCVSDSPFLHPRITEAEKDLYKTHKPGGDKPKQSVPWRKMLTYIPFGVVCTTHAIQNFTLYLLMLCLPLFLKGVMKFDIQNNSLFFSLPFVTNIIGVCITGVVADRLVSKKIFSTSVIRKMFQCTGLLGMAAMITIPGYLNCSQYVLVIVCLSASTFFEAIGQTAGYGSNVVDIAPRYASVTFGISNTFASIPGMVAPLIVAELTPNDTISEWRSVFYIAAILAVISAVIFGCFSSSELAPWAAETPIELTVTADRENCTSKKLNSEPAHCAAETPIELTVTADRENCTSKNLNSEPAHCAAETPTELTVTADRENCTSQKLNGEQADDFV